MPPTFNGRVLFTIRTKNRDALVTHRLDLKEKGFLCEEIEKSRGWKESGLHPDVYYFRCSIFVDRYTPALEKFCCEWDIAQGQGGLPSNEIVPEEAKSDGKVELPTIESGPSGERCDRCYYYEFVTEIDEGWSEGECRAANPIIGSHPAECGSGIYGDFPIVMDSYWCGEFRPRPQPKE